MKPKCFVKVLVILLCWFSLAVYAYPDKQTRCVFLGANPSLLIKFKNYSSTKYPALAPDLLQKLSSTMATFTKAKAMSNEAYIVFFIPNKELIKTQITPGCYPQPILDRLIQELKLKLNLDEVAPNILMKLMQIKRSKLVPVVGPKQWNLLTPPGGINAQAAFNITTGSPNAITAVLDTGILNNNSLNPNILSGVTFNNAGSFSPGATPSCDASCSGYNHGTHVAGTVSASGVLAYGENIYGVAPTAKVLPVNVFTKFTNPADCGGFPPCIGSYSSDQINAMNWLNGQAFTGLPAAPYVTTVNMSLGNFGFCSGFYQTSVNQLLAKNISFSIAAGNDNFDANFFTPANCNGVMVVAATGPQGFGADYSNYGSNVSFAAPGGEMIFSVTDGIYSTVENSYTYFEGTSMAAPHVAGLGALLYSLDPTLTPTLMLSLIQTTATPFPPGGPGYSCVPGKPCGSGIINAFNAVIATAGQAPVLAWVANLTATVDNVNQATLQWNPASWQPARSTPIIYTVNLNGSDVASCTDISTTTCVLNNLSTNVIYTVYVKATDSRKLYGPAQSNTQQFVTGLSPLYLTGATRNPLRKTQAFIYYQTRWVGSASVYIINGTPPGATVENDASHSRFIVSNITTPKQINNVTITAVINGDLYQSNAITIPSIL